jgi:hypothetical protein
VLRISLRIYRATILQQESLAGALAVVPLSRRISQLLALALDHPLETFHDVVNGVPTGQRVGVVLLQPREERIARAEAESPLFRRAKRSPQIIKGRSHFLEHKGSTW